jgi:acylphosphatase
LFVNGKKCLIAGRVQGVFYRATIARRAHELGVRGYARNLADGQVEVLVCGDAQAMQQLIEWLWVGSSASQVTRVEVTDADCDPAALPQRFATA